ncbi:MAG: Gldg family protein [Ruminococcus sp.]|nr:Gldg family protein [Ruminococcus sp.]
MTALVLAIIVVVNLIVGQIPEQYRNIDVSSTNIYEITDTSRDFLNELDKEVTFTVFAVEEDTDERIKTFISKYASLSDQISVEWIDPVLHPSAVTEAEAEEDTILVECEETGKSTLVYFTDIVVYDEYSYYYYGTYTESEFDGEGQLTSAVNYVTSENTQTIYMTTGHGEVTFTSTIQEMLDKNSYTMAETNTLMNNEIPDDCDLLVMYAPETDLTEDEVEGIQEYMAAGGDFMLLIGDTNVYGFENLSGLMAEYGMEPVDGYIADTQRCYQGNAYYIFPELSVSGDMAENISSEMVLMIYAHGLNVIDAERDTITTHQFMTTSTSGYAVTDTTETAGEYALGVTATEEVEDGETRFTVIAGGTMIDSQIIDSFASLDNITLFMNAVTANFDGVENISIEAKSLAVEYNTVQYVGLLSLLVIFGIPVIVLIGGFIVWFRRRKA